VALSQSSLARPGQLVQAPPPTGLAVGGQRRRGGRKVRNSWVKAEFERRETQQDGKTTEEYSCKHCQRTLTGLNATRLKNHLLNPGRCSFLYSPSAQEVAKQVDEVMTALQACKPASSRGRAPSAHPMFQVSLCVGGCVGGWVDGWVELQVCADRVAEMMMQKKYAL